MQKIFTYLGYLFGYKLILWLLLLATSGLIILRPGYEYTVASYTLSHAVTPTQHLLYSLANFDGIHYIHIAQRGYIDEARFFPLYPLAINILSWPLRWVLPTQLALVFASLLVSFAAYIGVLYLLARLNPWPTTNWRVALTILAFPTSFFFVASYTESLFLFLVLATIWLSRQKYWYLAVAVAALATVTRLVGVLVWVALIGEWLNQAGVFTQISKARSFLKMKLGLIDMTSKALTHCSHHKLLCLSFLIGIAPLFAYMWYNHLVWGDSLYFLHAHQLLGNGRSAESVVNPAITVYRYLKILLTVPLAVYEWKVALLEALFTLVGFGALVVATSRKALSLPWLALCWGFLAVPILSGTLTGMPRYVLLCFPMYWLLSQLPQKWWYSYLILGLILNMFLFLLFAHGYYIA